MPSTHRPTAPKIADAANRTRLGQAKYEFRQQLKPTVAPLTAAITLGLAAGNLQAATITVDTLDDTIDSGVCSLRSATYAATTDSTFAGCVAGGPGSDTIVFASGLTGTLQLDAGASTLQADASLRIGSDMVINGPGIDDLTIRGDDASPVIYAKYDGGGYTPNQVSISGLTITNGRADYGGGIYSKVPSLSLLNTRVSGNIALEAGGGIWHEPETGPRAFNLFFSEITGNQAATTNTSFDAGGGGVGVNFSGYSGAIQIGYTTFDDNIANGKGGGLYIAQKDYADVTLDNNEFNNNRSKYAGGGAYLALGYADLTLTENTFSGNDALATLTGATGNGGGLVLVEDVTFVSQANIELGANVFDDNTAEGNGGGAYIDVAYENVADTKQIAIAGTSYFLYNEADGSGGGFHIVAGDSVDVDIQSTATYVNAAGVDGGGAFISALNSSVTVDYLVSLYDQSGDYGGGIRANLDNVDLYALDLRAKYNYAPTTGGGVALFSSNGSSISTNQMGLVENDSGFGGGLSLNGSFDLFEMNESVVTRNTASAGAGLDFFPNGGNRNIYLKYSELSENAATISGGAAFVSLDDGSFRLWNSTVSGNNAGEEGGGLWLGSSATPTMALSYSTIAYNTADEGGGVFLGGAETNVYSTILSGNTATTSGAAVQGTGEITVSYSLVDDIGTNVSFVNDGNNLLKYSAELNALGDNGGFSRTHEPAQSSPVLNAGPDSAVLSQYDQRGAGYDRLFGSNQDIGAFERQTVIDVLFRDRFEQP